MITYNNNETEAEAKETNEYVKEFVLITYNNNETEAEAKETKAKLIKAKISEYIEEFHDNILEEKVAELAVIIFSNKQTNFAKAFVRDMSDEENMIEKSVLCLLRLNEGFDNPYLEKSFINLLGNLLKYCNIVEKYNNNATSNSVKTQIYTFVKTLNEYPKNNQNEKIYEILKIYNISDDFVDKVLNSSKEFEEK